MERRILTNCVHVSVDSGFKTTLNEIKDSILENQVIVCYYRDPCKQSATDEKPASVRIVEMTPTAGHNEFAPLRSTRVRAILLTADGKLLFIKRVKPNSPPYWVAPGGGVEADETLLETLDRELREELGATVEVIERAFVLRHQKAGKDLEEHFFICKLVDYDLSLRHGPEFDDPERGEYLLDKVDIDNRALVKINIKTSELRDWLLENGHNLRSIAS